MARRPIRRDSGDQRPGKPLPEPAGMPDDQLILKAQSGSEQAFTELFRKYWPYACRLAWTEYRSRADIEDIAQVSLIHAFKSIGDFTVGRARFTSWLYRIVMNCGVDHDRRRSTCEKGECGLPECRPRWARDPARNHRDDAMEEAAWQRLYGLRPRVRVAFMLHQFEHRDFKEVACILGCSVSSAWRYCHEAMAELKRRTGERRRELSV